MVEVQQRPEQPSPIEFGDLTPETRAESIRYFAAARARGQETIDSILNKPEITPEDLERIDQQAEPIYNPILEPRSLDERRKYWDRRQIGYDEALNQWKNQFKTLVNQVTDEARTSAIRSILPNQELQVKNLSDISEDDAMVLFGEYSDNKSDIDKFMNRALDGVDKTEEGKLNLESLKARLPHLRWVATGFFGQETAATIANQILLEAQARNDWSNARRFFEGGPGEQPEAQQAAAGEIPDEEKDELSPGPLPPQEPMPAPVARPATKPEEEAENPPSRDSVASTDEKPAESNDQAVQEANAPANANEESKPQDDNTDSPEDSRSPNAVDWVITELTAKKEGFDLIQELNENLNIYSSIKDKSRISVGVAPKVLMDHIISTLAEGIKVEVGDIRVNKDDTIFIKQIRINKGGGAVVLNNVIIGNGPEIPSESISITAENMQKNPLARMFAGNIIEKISTINDVFLGRLKEKIAPENSSWIPKSLTVSKGNINVAFEKAQPTLSSAGTTA